MKLSQSDPEVFAALADEEIRQRDGLELIPSENYVSAAVREAAGSVLTNKYAEGYPGKRYYGGCEFYDVIETLAIERAKQLFGAGYANVQPHAGAPANMAVYLALLQPRDTVLGQSLAHGGHLTHGSPVNASGKLYDFQFYGVDPATGQLDYDHIAGIAEKHRPKLITSGYSAYSRVIDWAKMREIADSVGAYLMVDMAHFAGLVVAEAYPNPMPHAHVVTSTTHKTLRGPRGGLILTNDEALAKRLNSAVFPGMQGGPLMHLIAAKAVAFGEALQPEFKAYGQQVIANAKALAAALQEEGFQIISGGTDNHLMLVDLRPQGVTGKVAQEELDKAHITLNKNMIPGDPETPFVTSGVRLGTPAVTTRGMGEGEMAQIATLIAKTLGSIGNEHVYAEVRQTAQELTDAHPLPD